MLQPNNQKNILIKYLAIYFQVFAYEEPQMNADACLPRTHQRSSAVCESCFPGKKSRKTFARVLITVLGDAHERARSCENMPRSRGTPWIICSSLMLTEIRPAYAHPSHIPVQIWASSIMLKNSSEIRSDSDHYHKRLRRKYHHPKMMKQASCYLSNLSIV